MQDRLTRRTLLHRAAIAGAALAGVPDLSAKKPKPKPKRKPKPPEPAGPIQNVVVSCQENRSFDHYFGYAPEAQAAGFGPPAGYVQPDASGAGHAPFELVFFDAGAAEESQAAIDLLSPGGLFVKDDLTPGWPGTDPVRDFLLDHTQLVAVEILTTPKTAAIIASKRASLSI